MNTKKVTVLASMMAVMLGMSGCGNAIPDMTETEMQSVGEYAAVTLMKYDANHRSRLVDLALLEKPQQPEEEAPAEAASEENKEETGMRPTADTPISGEAQTAALQLEEVLELPEGVSLTYREITVCDSYPDSEADYFSLTATAGKKLLVVGFDLSNGSGQDQEIDLLSKKPVLNFTVNGEYSRRALTTMLMDDVTTYSNTLPSGSTEQVVAVIEVEESMAENITSLSLKAKNDSKVCTIQLF